MTGKPLQVEELSWDDVKNEIWETNPVLAEKLDCLKKKFTFIKASYLYGDKIYHEGMLYLPTKDGNTVPLQSNDVPNHIREKLVYCHVPLGLILNKSVEVFFETPERVVPSKLLNKGSTFGLWEVFDPEPSEFLKKVWNLSAGARSVFMLPKIADAMAHTRLKRDYGIAAYAPKELLDQYKVFRELARQMYKKENWQCEILFFSGDWLKEHNNDLSYVNLHKFWLKEAWQQSYNCRNQLSYHVAWESFSREITRRNWKPRPYIINTIKHLMAISEGIFPGFAPTGESQAALPVNLIQEAYINSYSLKQYAPIIMQPFPFKTPEKPVYYSLYLPTLLEYAPHAENPRSIMTDMRELKNLTEMLLSTTNSDICYDFFHCDKDHFSEIRNSSEMLKDDKSLLDYPKKYGELKFPENSPFFRGCIRISRKK